MDGRRDADAGEHREPGQSVADPADRQHADQRGERDQQHHDAADQGFLVVRPEVRDREVLDRNGSRLIAVSPTAITGPPSGPVIAAASSATPSATAAAIMPASAPASRRRTVG